MTREHRIAIAAMSIETAANLQDLVRGCASLAVGPIATPDEVSELTRDADAVVVALQPLTEAHIASFGKAVSVIGRAGVGLDTVDLAAAERHGVAVVHEPGAATGQVADHAAALLLAGGRQVVAADRALRTGSGWARSDQLGRVVDYSRATLGVVGLGRIGRALIERMRPFFARLIAFDPFAGEPPGDVEVVKSLSSLLRESDFVSLHLPLDEKTRLLIGEAELATMRRDAFLVNVSRGGLVDDRALAHALGRGEIAGAALDVFSEEPLPADSPLRSAPNLILTPHLAGYAEGGLEHLTRLILDDVLAHLDGSSLLHGRYAVPPRGVVR